MKLKSLKILRLPGIETGFELTKIGRGLTIIQGPNGIGKTSICRAVQILLWPEKNGDSRQIASEIEAVWSDVAWEAPPHELRVSRIYGTTRWSTELHDVTPPELPKPHLSSCFTIRIDQMFSEDTTDQALATDIANLMAGGYDLNIVKNNARLSPSRPVALASQLQSVLTKIKSVEDNEAQIKSQENDLPDLKQRLSKASEARNELPKLEIAIKLAQYRMRLAETCGEKDLLPAALNHMLGSDIEKLDNITSQIREQTEQLRLAEINERSAEAAIDACQLPNNWEIPEAVLLTWQTRPPDIKVVEEEIRGRKEAVEIAKDRSAVALKVLAPYADPNLAIELTSDVLKCAQEYIVQSLRHSAEMIAHKRLLDLVPELPIPLERHDLKAGSLKLSEWLSMPVTDIQGQRVVSKSILTLALLCLLSLVVGCVLLWQNEQYSWPLITFALGGLFAAVFIFFVFSITSDKRSGEARRQNCQNQFSALKLTGPQSWVSSEVEACARELAIMEREAHVSSLLAQNRTIQREVIKSNQEQLNDQAKQLESRRLELEEETGLDLSWPNFENVWLLENLRSYQLSVEQNAVANAELSSAEKRLAGILAGLNDQMRKYCTSDQTLDVTDFESAQNAIQAYRRRSQDLAHALQDRQSAASSKSLARTALAEYKRDLDSFLKERGLKGVDEFKTISLHWEKWTRLCNDEQTAINHISMHESWLEDRPEYIKFKEYEAIDLFNSQKKIADEFEQLNAKIAEIEARISQAKQGSHVEDTYLDEQRLRQSLDAERQKALFAIAGKFMLEQAEESQAINQPDILQRTSTLFAQVTDGAYEVTVLRGQGSNKNPEFRARSTESNTYKSLSELSGGTRLQLLLCARLAFVDHTPHGDRLPLFFDEAFALSDPHRCEALVKCVKTLVDSGRQIIYLTSDPTDQYKFQKAFGESSELFDCIDLGLLRRKAAAFTDLIHIPPLDKFDAPLPGETAAAYAQRIAIPKLNPYQPLDSVHLYYVMMDDLNAMHNCLNSGISSIGQWRTLRHPIPDRLMTLEKDQKTASWVSLTEMFLIEWRRWRGKPMDAEDLNLASLGSTYLPRFQRLLSICNGDAQHMFTLIDGSQNQANGPFGSINRPMRAKFNEFCLDHGYLSDDKPQTLEAIAVKLQNLPDQFRISSAEITERVNILYTYANAYAGPCEDLLVS